MKKILILTIVISFMLISCNQTKKTEKTPVDNHQQVKHQEQSELQTINESNLNNAWTDNMELDGDKKWVANKETNMGVIAMLSLIRTDKSNSIDDYKKLGDALNKEKNMIIKECTMKGASHDNLHVFLMPLIDKVALLQNTSKIEDGSKVNANLLEHLELYDTYFE